MRKVGNGEMRNAKMRDSEMNGGRECDGERGEENRDDGFIALG